MPRNPKGRQIGDIAVIRFVVLIDTCTIYRECEIAALEQTRNQPMYIILHKTIGSLSLLLSLLADLEKDESRDDEDHKTDSDDHLSVHAFHPPSSV